LLPIVCRGRFSFLPAKSLRLLLLFSSVLLILSLPLLLLLVLPSTFVVVAVAAVVVVVVEKTRPRICIRGWLGVVVVVSWTMEEQV